MSADLHPDPDLQPDPDLPVLDRDFTHDPQSVYAGMRAEGPVQQAWTNSGLRVWLVTRYAEARSALADPRLRKDFRRNREIIRSRFDSTGQREFGAALAEHMLNLDPPATTPGCASWSRRRSPRAASRTCGPGSRASPRSCSTTWPASPKWTC